MLGKLFGKVKDKLKGDDAPPARPVTQTVPDDWNDAYKSAHQGVAAAPSPAAEGSPKIHFENLGVSLDVKRGTTILDAAIEAGVDLNHYCGGMASCGSCRVEVQPGSAVSEMDMMEEATLDVVLETDNDRLGCQTKILGEVRVVVPEQD